MFASINFRGSPTHQEKDFAILFSRQGHNVWSHPLQFPAWKWWPMACIFNIETIVRFYTYQSVLVAVGKNLPCQRELKPRIYSQLRRVDRRSWKLSAVCSMVLQPVDLLDLGLKGTALDLSAKKFVEAKIFAGTNFCELVFDHKNIPLYGIHKKCVWALPTMKVHWYRYSI